MYVYCIVDVCCIHGCQVAQWRQAVHVQLDLLWQKVHSFR